MRATFVDDGYLPADGPFLHYTVEDFPLRLIGLDTVLPGKIGGALCAARLGWLAGRLAEQPERPTLIFMHHPPFPSGIVFMDQPPLRRCRGAGADRPGNRQVRQIVCGHIHRAMHVSWAGTSAAIAPSSVYQMNLAFRPDGRFDPPTIPPAISLYLWQDGVGPGRLHQPDRQDARECRHRRSRAA